MRVVRPTKVCLLACVAVVASLDFAAAAESQAKYVVHISVDGLAPRFLEALLNEGRTPTFKRLQSEGAWTHNARTDFDYTVTLPNHTCMVTGRPVSDKTGEPQALAGHFWTHNSDPGERTIHSARHDYVPSTFDAVHDAGLRTGLFVSKSKFVLYDQSYDERNGAPDRVGDDNGRDKVDVYFRSGDTAEMTDRFLEEMKSNPINYSFVHFADTDNAGHAKGWGSPEYNDALAKVDAQLGRMLELFDSDERFRGHTALILSADHGGVELNHGINSDVRNYTIPFYTWGAGVAADKDLYELNTRSRANPQSSRPDYISNTPQPIRNGDGANLALTMLGLGPIPGSTIDFAQDLCVGAGR